MTHHRVRLRVHIAAVGFEVVRVTDPLISLQADRAILLTRRADDAAADHLKKILEILKAEKKAVHVIEGEIWDTNTIVGEVGAIVAGAPYHDYFFNVSTGPKPACIAGTIAGMFWNVSPYYVGVDYSKPIVHAKDDYPVKGPPQFIPTFHVESLDLASVEALKFLVSQDEPPPKRDLLRRLRDEGIVRPRRKKRATPQAFQAQTDAILQKLARWEFIERIGHGQGLRISVTDKGRDGWKMFKHMLESKPTLPFLRT